MELQLIHIVNNIYKNPHVKNKNQFHIIPNISDVPITKSLLKMEWRSNIKEWLALLGFLLCLNDFTYSTTSEMGIIIPILWVTKQTRKGEQLALGNINSKWIQPKSICCQSSL